MNPFEQLSDMDLVIDNICRLVGVIYDNKSMLNLMLVCKQWHEIGERYIDYLSNNGRGFKHIAAIGDISRVDRILSTCQPNQDILQFALIFGTPSVQRLILPRVDLSIYPEIAICVAINGCLPQYIPQVEEILRSNAIQHIYTAHLSEIISEYKRGKMHRINKSDMEFIRRNITYHRLNQNSGNRISAKNPDTGHKIGITGERFYSFINRGYMFDGINLIHPDYVFDQEEVDDGICCATKRDGQRCKNKWSFSHEGKGYCGVHIKKFK